MTTDGTLVLSRAEIARLLPMDECITAVERAFRLYGEGKVAAPGVLGVHGESGSFHIKAGVLDGERSYFAAKVNGNFPENPERFGLPTIQGVVVLCDAGDGRPLAIMDSAEITARRTGAATAVAAKCLARRDSRVATICGCGVQGRYQLRALAQVLPLQRVYACDLRPGQAEQFAREMGEELGLEITPAPDLGNAVRHSDICITCTPARRPVLHLGDVRRGMFIAAVGADHPEKQELDPALLAAHKVVADLVEQCATIGDLHHAISAGVMNRADVHGELGEVVAGKKAGRVAEDEIIIFDSTGLALQDAAAAAVVYEQAALAGNCAAVNLAA